MSDPDQLHFGSAVLKAAVPAFPVQVSCPVPQHCKRGTTLAELKTKNMGQFFCELREDTVTSGIAG
jgi:hypothetical protein